jgi:pimeloyl-ACP methyl ester carboxylesterase
MPAAPLADGTALAYQEAGTGPAVVLLHAFPMAAEMWRPQLAGLADGYRVLAPDLPGFGGSPARPGTTVDTIADAVAAFLDAVGDRGPVVLGGLSMGGYAAFAFARRFPERLRGLILADTKPEPDDAAARANRDRQLAGLADGSLTAAGLVEQMLPKLLGDTTRASRPEVVAEVRRIGEGQSTAGLAAAVRALRDRPDAVPGLAAVRVPTLVLAGAEDAVTPPAGARATASRIAGATFVELPAAGHLSNLETPEAFTAAVRRFLDGL